MTEKPPIDESAEKSASDVADVKAPAVTSRKSKAKNPAKKQSRAKSKKPAKKAGKNLGGRPVWQPSIPDRTTVEQMKFCGESEAMIARALKIDVATLRKHCAYELDNGYANQRRLVIGKLFEASEKGNVSATNRLIEMGKVSKAAGALADREKPAKSEPKAAPPGKKEQQKSAAQQVTGKFAPPSAPKLVVNNP